MLFGLLLSTSGTAFADDDAPTALRLEGAPEYGLCPGEFLELTLYATLPSGKEVKVKDKLIAADFTRGWDIMPVGKSLGLYMPEDPRAAWGKPGVYEVALKSDPDVKTKVEIPMRWDCPVRVVHAGAQGSSGRAGVAGDSSHLGGSGGPGGRGGRGPTVKVTIDRVEEPASGAKVRRVGVTDPATKAVSWFAVTSGTEVVIGSAGGQGGVGGHGGSPYGPGGAGGEGGEGGRVQVTVDPSAEKHLKNIEFVSPGGKGGPGGDPGEDGEPGPGGPEGLGGPEAEVVVGAVAEWPAMTKQEIDADEEGLTKADRHVRNKQVLRAVGGTVLGLGVATAVGDVVYTEVQVAQNQATYDQMVLQAQSAGAGSSSYYAQQAEAEAYKLENIDTLTPLNLVSEAGAGVAVLGGVLLFLGLRDQEEAPMALLMPLHDGAVVGMSGGF